MIKETTYDMSMPVLVFIVINVTCLYLGFLAGSAKKSDLKKIVSRLEKEIAINEAEILPLIEENVFLEMVIYEMRMNHAGKKESRQKKINENALLQ